MEGAEQESLRQNIRVPGEVLTSNSRRGGRTRNCTIWRKPRWGHPRGRCQGPWIHVPDWCSSINWLTQNKIVYVLWGVTQIMINKARAQCLILLQRPVIKTLTLSWWLQIIIIPKICSLSVVNWQSHLKCAIKEFYLFESQSLETVVHVNWCSILFNKCDSGLFLKCHWVSCNTVDW